MSTPHHESKFSSSPAVVAALGLLMTGCSPCCETATPAARTPSPESPLVCTLSPKELNERREALIPGLIQRAERVMDVENGLSLQFPARPGLLDELARVIEQERTCCSFLRFHLEVAPQGGPVTFCITGPAGTQEMLRSL